MTDKKHENKYFHIEKKRLVGLAIMVCSTVMIIILYNASSELKRMTTPTEYYCGASDYVYHQYEAPMIGISMAIMSFSCVAFLIVGLMVMIA